MTAQLLASELSNLIQESKRKHNDLRQVPTDLFLDLSHQILVLKDTVGEGLSVPCTDIPLGCRKVARGAQEPEGTLGSSNWFWWVLLF